MQKNLAACRIEPRTPANLYNASVGYDTSKLYRDTDT